MIKSITTNALLITAMTAAMSTNARAFDYSAHCVNPREGATFGFADIEIDGSTAKIKQIVPHDDFGNYTFNLYPKVVFNDELLSANLITADESITGFTVEINSDRCQLTDADQKKSLKCKARGTSIANVTLQVYGDAGFRSIEGFTADWVELFVGDPGAARPMTEVIISLGSVKGRGLQRFFASTDDVYFPELCHSDL